MKPFLPALALFVLALTPLLAYAARVDVLPRKILLDDRQRSADITLLNLGDKPGIVRISMISYAQDEKGEYKELAAPLNPAFDPEKLVRISPKQFALPPGGRQKVRLSIQKPADLPDGEYRFHIKALSFDEGDFSVRRTPVRGSGTSIKTNVAVAIPVVVRKGALSTGAKLGNIRYLSAEQSGTKQPALQLDITRTGAAGTMGTLHAYSESGGPREIGILNNVNVFSEIKTRTVVIPLREVPPGNIRLQYVNDFDDKGVLDEVVVEK